MPELLLKGKTNEGLISRIRKSAFGKAVAQFLYSPYYISAIALCVFLCYALSLDALSYGILALACIATFLLCDEATPIIVPVLFSPFVPSMSWYRNGQTYDPLSICMFCIYGAGLIAAIIYHMCIRGGFKRLRYGGRLGAATVALGLGLLVSGFFSSGYKADSLLHAFVQIAPLCILFFFLRSVIKRNKNTITYLAVAVAAAGAVICADLALTYLFNKPLIDGGFTDKGEIITGWGISNNVGAAILQTVPLVFYLACNEEKHPWFYLLFAVCMEICIVFTFSRAALLFSAPVGAACVIAACIKAKNRRQIWITAGAVCAAALLAFVLLHEKILGMLEFYLQNGFNDRGRFEIWELGFELFADNPIFGVGQHFIDHTGGNTHSYFFHNTPIQFLAAGGLVGILTYAFYRVETVRLMLRKLTLARFFLGLTAAAIVLTALLDTGFMRFFSQVFTVTALLFAEHDLDYADWFYSCPPLGVKPLYER